MTARLTAGIAAVAFGLAGCSATGAPPVNTANTYTPTTTSVAAVPIPQPADFRIDVIVTDKRASARPAAFTTTPLTRGRPPASPHNHRGGS